MHGILRGIAWLTIYRGYESITSLSQSGDSDKCKTLYSIINGTTRFFVQHPIDRSELNFIRKSQFHNDSYQIGSSYGSSRLSPVPRPIYLGIIFDQKNQKFLSTNSRIIPGKDYSLD